MDYGHKWTDEELKKLERRISAEYKQAAAEMQKKVEKYYADFARKDQIKRKEVSEGKISQAEYTSWRRNQMLVGKRWEEMQTNLAQDIHTVNMKTASMTRQFSYDAYAMNFNYGTFEAESGSGIDTAFTLYDRSTVERLIRDDPDMLPPPGKRVSRRIAEGKDVLWNKQVIQSVMTQSILQGESIPNIATRLAEAVGDTNRKAAIRNARTMTTGAENAGREDSYKRAESMGIKMEQMWIATLDNRTRHEHRQLDGQKRKVGEPFEVDGQQINFPGDPSAAPYLVWNCRCTLIGIVANSDVEYYKKSMEAAGNIKGNPDMTYEKWKNQHSKKKNSPDTIQQVSWVDKIKEISNRNEITEADVITAGKIIMQEMQETKAQYILSMEETQRIKDETWAKYHSANISFEERMEAARAYNEALKKLNNDWVEYANKLKAKLAEVRDMGIDASELKSHLKGNKEMQKVVSQAYGYYPTAWTKNSIAEGNLKVKKVKRGYYAHWRSEIAISGDSDARSVETAIHELGHRFERTQSLNKYEAEFYNRRTAGEQLQWMGSGYGRDEKTRKDNFVNAYMGKDYGGSAYELCSMGFEYAFTHPERLAKDPDMEAWIFGLLAIG